MSKVGLIEPHTSAVRPIQRSAVTLLERLMMSGGMMRKIAVAAVAIAAVCALLLGGCTNSGGGQSGPVKLEVQANFGATDPGLKVLQELTDAYIAQNQNLEIELVPSTDTYEADLKVRLASRDLPDIWATHGWSLLRYSSFLEPLQTQPWAANFNPALAAAMKNEAGEFFALPIETDVAGIFYSRTALTKAGVDPNSITSWETFDASLAKLKAAGVTPITSSGKDSWFAGNVADFITSGNFTDAQLEGFKSGTFDEPGYTQIMDRIAGWVTQGYFNPDYSSATTDDMGRALAEGKTGFIFVQNYISSTVLGFNPQADIGYLPIPSTSGTSYLVGGEGRAYGVAKTSPNKEAALKFLAYLAEPGNVSRLATATGAIPGLTNATSDLGALKSSYDQIVVPGKYPLKPYFDRVYLPNGIWDTMVTTTDGVITGQLTAAAATAQMKSSYDSLR